MNVKIFQKRFSHYFISARSLPTALFSAIKNCPDLSAEAAAQNIKTP